jgi:hypothetical protein
VAVKKHYITDMGKAKGFFRSQLSGGDQYVSASLTSSVFVPAINVSLELKIWQLI